MIVLLNALAAGALAMNLTSPSFKDHARIPKHFTCDGEDASPPLAWSGLPDGTKSLALVVDDPDAPPGTWVHWVLYDIPPAPPLLAQGLPKGAAAEKLKSGALQGSSWGVDSFGRVGWSGPCPPPGKPHRYFFRLYALSAPSGLPPRATKAQLLAAIKDKTLASAELVGLYGR